MKKVAMMACAILIALTTVMCSKSSKSMAGVWEVMGHKAVTNGVEKTEYWIITDSTMLWTQWKDNGTGPLEEIKQLTNGFRFKYKVKDDIISLGKNDEMTMKIIEINPNTIVLESPSYDGSKVQKINLKRVEK